MPSELLKRQFSCLSQVSTAACAELLPVTVCQNSVGLAGIYDSVISADS